MERIYSFNEYVTKINEGLIKTYPIEKTVNDLRKLLLRYNINFDIIIYDNTFILKMLNFNNCVDLSDKLEIILSTCFDLYGWFPSEMTMENIYGMKNTKKFNKSELLWIKDNILTVDITFESKYDLVENDIPEKLYHLTIKQFDNNILKNGIIPKSKSKLTLHDYDGRIYLCKSINECEALIPRMKLFYSTEKNNILFNPKNVDKIYKKNIMWVIFEVDTVLGKITKLYKDPNYLNGYYVLDNISKDSIKIVKQE